MPPCYTISSFIPSWRPWEAFFLVNLYVAEHHVEVGSEKKKTVISAWVFTFNSLSVWRSPSPSASIIRKRYSDSFSETYPRLFTQPTKIHVCFTFNFVTFSTASLNSARLISFLWNTWWSLDNFFQFLKNITSYMEFKVVHMSEKVFQNWVAVSGTSVTSVKSAFLLRWCASPLPHEA